MSQFKKQAQEKYDQSKKYLKEKNVKEKSGNLLQKFIKGLKLGERVPVLITTFLIMLILWVPMMYASMTISIFTGQDSMSNKELNQLQTRLEDRYSKIIGD
ncbi:hypothetical protein [Mammaliicoccus sciuri]|uniref:hypothetical protein n=1 Tax=Mammaliicoccus sciuri TaxID=1296 RepID=UPI00194F5F5A|nr:hypothetical protein [Mammaliicoccus sciuri]MEB7397241.1 hypothetical protein [Mammaliicoccus sciuri]